MQSLAASTSTSRRIGYATDGTGKAIILMAFNSALT